MFSLICTIENIFADVFNHHLGGAYHLATEKSLKRFMLRFGFKEHSSWWFGTDMDDLFRSFLNSNSKNKKFKPLEKISLESNFIDGLQIQLDQRERLCSEVHMLLKR